MAVLTDNDRALLFADWQRDNETPLAALTKADIRAAVNAIDQYLSDNAAAINQAIPQPARAGLTTKQKAQLLTYVVRQRYIVEA